MENALTKTELLLGESRACKSAPKRWRLVLLTSQVSATVEVTHRAQIAGFFFEFA